MKSGYLTLAFWEAQKGWNCYVTPTFSGVPNAIRPRKSELATSPLPTWGPKREHDCCVTTAFSGVPKAKCGEKIKNCYFTRAFSGAQIRAEALRSPYILGASQSKSPRAKPLERNQKWLPHMCVL